METPTPSLIKETYTVHGMSCQGCASTVLKALNTVGGIEHATVDVLQACVNVEYDPQRADPARMKRAVDALGYQFVLPGA